MSDKPKINAAPIIAAILLLLPVLYVVSYLALVVPAGASQTLGIAYESGQIYQQFNTSDHYRWASEQAAVAFWPLEQMDRRLRPGSWVDEVPITIMHQEFEGRIGVDFGP